MLGTLSCLTVYAFAGGSDACSSLRFALSPRTTNQGCLAECVPRLVYVSTVNVCFAGHSVEGGDEFTVPYAPLSRHSDEYSRSKAEAEALVLTADGTLLPSPPPWRLGQPQQPQPQPPSLLPPLRLRTCALRAAGIYGDGEERHLPRIASIIRCGLGPMAMGDPRARCDWLYVENLTHAMVLAAAALEGAPPRATASGSASAASGPTSASADTASASAASAAGSGAKKKGRAISPSSPLRRRSYSSAHGPSHGGSSGLASHASADPPPGPACGQAYFISDGDPINNFAFFKRIFEGIGYGRLFYVYVPVWAVYPVALAAEAVLLALNGSASLLTGGACCPFSMPPMLLTRAEVLKAGVNHWFRNDKAERELGYAPVVGMEEAIARTQAALVEAGLGGPALARQRMGESSREGSPGLPARGFLQQAALVALVALVCGCFAVIHVARARGLLP